MQTCQMSTEWNQEDSGSMDKITRARLWQLIFSTDINLPYFFISISYVWVSRHSQITDSWVLHLNLNTSGWHLLGYSRLPSKISIKYMSIDSKSIKGPFAALWLVSCHTFFPVWHTVFRYGWLCKLMLKTLWATNPMLCSSVWLQFHLCIIICRISELFAVYYQPGK